MGSSGPAAFLGDLTGGAQEAAAGESCSCSRSEKLDLLEPGEVEKRSDLLECEVLGRRRRLVR